MIKAATAILAILALFQLAQAYPTGAPLCDVSAASLATIQGGMGGPLTAGGVGAQSGITWTISATTVPAGHSVAHNFSLPSGLLLGFLFYAQHADGNRYGSFDLNLSQPAGYAKYVNATLAPGGVCPGGNGPSITHSNNNCDYGFYYFVYNSDVNHPGVVTFYAIILIDGNFTPDARGNWFVMTPQNVTFTPAGTTGFATSQTATSKTGSANGLVAWFGLILLITIWML